MFCGFEGDFDLGHSVIFFHRRESSRRENGRVACGRSEPEIWEIPGQGLAQCAAPACSLGAQWQNLSMGNLHQLWGPRSHLSLVSGASLLQAGISNWREAQDSGFKCPEGLLTHLTFFSGRVTPILGPAWSQRGIRFPWVSLL